MNDSGSSRFGKVKFDQEKKNPCLKEQNLTFKCYDQFNYDHEKCEKQISNYKICKSFWGQVYSQRKRDGIKPYLPEPHEREQIKTQFFEEFLKHTG